ncbi:hypothetical protein LSAT2_022148 [Lamellibrachia satsuma]|nr:hypothetical protein LSAT2_022148 [Lamellibrachia satsuma]
MTQLCRLQLDSCLSPQALTAISAGLTRGGHQVEYLNLRHNAGLLETIEAGRELGDTLGKMTRLRELELRYCGLTDQSLTALSSGLTRHGGQQLKYLGCGDNPLTDASSDTFRRLLTRCPKLRIWPLGCHLSDECGRQLKEQFGEERFYWESL